MLTLPEEELVPTYQYACTDCGDRSEVVQKFTDDPLSVCAACGGKLRKVFSPVGIVFKGSGFYRTDSRKGSSAMDTAKASESGGGDSKKADVGANGTEKVKSTSSENGSGGSSASSDSATSSGSKTSSSAGAKVA